MSRINVVEQHTASPQQTELFKAIQNQLGIVPNFLKVFANSPAALNGFLGLFTIAGNGTLDPQTRERIALTLAQKNSCQYCLSAHTKLGQNAGLSDEEITANRAGTSKDAKAALAVSFAQSLIEHKGEVTNDEIQALRNAGYSESDIVEIITHTGMNFLTNLVGKVSRVKIDFPTVELQSVA